MGKPLLVVAALIAALWASAVARAAEVPAVSDEEILGETKKPRLRVDNARARLTFFDQYGRGYQSKAGPPQGPGSERLWVIQPAIGIGLEQRDDRFRHDFIGIVDVLSAASADALDAVSSASKYNEAGTLSMTSSFRASDRNTFSLRYGTHLEEHWRSINAGFGWEGRFADENTVVSASMNFIWDQFDDLHPRGWNDQQVARYTVNDNFSLTQVLSPTTLAVASYGVTFQSGTLAQTWNSVYIHDAQTYACFDDPSQVRAYDCQNRAREEFPKTRIRHAFSLLVAQHVPRTRSTLKARYRYYRDDFSLRAHTLTTYAYQWIRRRAYLRAMYRYHRQTGVDFYSESVAVQNAFDRIPRTADSDLAPFDAHQAGLKAVLYITPPDSPRGNPQYIDASFSRYQRTNNLGMNIYSIGYGREF